MTGFGKKNPSMHFTRFLYFKNTPAILNFEKFVAP